MSKPASTPQANFNNFCSALGIPCRPANVASAANTGRFMVNKWIQFPLGLKNLYEKNRSGAMIALGNLPTSSTEYRLAKTMVNAMVVHSTIAENKTLIDLVMTLRASLARTPEDHLTMVCNDLGIDRVPTDHKKARKMAAKVMSNLATPLHRARVVQRVNWIHTSLQSLPAGSPEREMARTIVSGLIQSRSMLPIKIRRNRDCLEVAASLQQVLMR